MDAIFNFLKALLSGLIDSFKTKNPVAYTIIALALGAVYFVAGQVLNSSLPDGTPYVGDQLRAALESIQNIVFLVATLLGAHTPTTQKVDATAKA